MKQFDVVGVGYCAVDYLGIVDRYPELDEKVMMTDFTIQGGGITATAMVAVARLGGRASYIGKVGDDEFGRAIIAGLQEEGVHTGAVVTQPGEPSQLSLVIVHRATGKRTIFATSGDVRLEPEDIRREDILAGKVLQVDAHHPAALPAAQWANDAGIPVVMDAGSPREGSSEIAERVDFLIASALFGGQDDPEAAANRLLTGRPKLAAVTLGPEGCVYATDEGTFRQAAFAVDVADTTGAGDVFHGAFSFGLAKGWPHRELIQFASAVAAMKCTKLGGRAGIPTLPQALEFLSTRSENEFWKSLEA